MLVEVDFIFECFIAIEAKWFKVGKITILPAHNCIKIIRFFH